MLASRPHLSCKHSEVNPFVLERSRCIYIVPYCTKAKVFGQRYQLGEERILVGGWGLKELQNLSIASLGCQKEEFPHFDYAWILVKWKGIIRLLHSIEKGILSCLLCGEACRRMKYNWIASTLCSSYIAAARWGKWIYSLAHNIFTPVMRFKHFLDNFKCTSWLQTKFKV